MSHQRTDRGLIALAFSSLFVMGFTDNLRSPYFSSFLQSTGLNDIEGSFFFLVPSCFAFIGSLTMTMFTRRWPIRNNIWAATLWMCLGFALLSLITHFWSMVVLGAIYGFGMGCSNVAFSLGVHAGASPQNSRRLFGGLQSMYAIASFTAPFLAAWLFEVGATWTASFRVAALFCAVLVTVLFLAGKPSNKRAVEVDHTHEHGQAPSKWRLWLMTAPLGFYLIGEVSISTRLALYLERDLGYTKENASLWLALFFALFTLGRLSCWVFDTSRWPQLRLLKLCASFGCGFYALGLLVHPIFFIFAGLCIAPFYPIALDWVGMVYRRHVDSAMSIAISFGYFTVVVMHFTLGQLSQEYGLKAALWVGPAGLFITVLSLILSSKMLSQNKIKH